MKSEEMKDWFRHLLICQGSDMKFDIFFLNFSMAYKGNLTCTHILVNTMNYEYYCCTINDLVVFVLILVVNEAYL